MKPETWTWYSNRVERDMTVARWGWYGKPVILFPTAAADCFDYERFKMIHVLKPLIQAGRIKLYCVDSITGDAWMRRDEMHPRNRIALQAAYDAYIANEVVPHIVNDCGGYQGTMVTAGASLGAYNAVNTAAKHPRWFDLVIAMSGTYDFDRWTDGWRDDNYYFNMPLYYLGGIAEGSQLDLIRRTKWVIATGQGRAEAPEESERLAHILQHKGADVDLQIWGRDVHHDWPTWRTMLPLFLNKLV